MNDVFVKTFVYPQIPDCIEIPTKLLKFPQRVLGKVPVPVENRFALTVDFSVDPGANQVIGVAFGLTINAMAPVVMVHGWNSGPWWWGPNPGVAPDIATPDACGVDPHQHDSVKGGFDFIQPFIQAKIPFHCQIQIDDQASIDDGGTSLRDKVESAAEEFGAKHVHLIGHSKGGLWIRKALPLLQNDGYGVYSLTTIDTPHHGSALADLLVEAHKHPQSALLNPKLLLGLLKAYKDGAFDLGTSVVEATTSTLPDPAGIQYLVDGATNVSQNFSAAADADLNADGTIQASEGCPYPAIAVNYQYRFLSNTQSVTLTPIQIAGKTILQKPVFNPTPSPQKNDLVVTVSSAQLNAFTPLSPYPGYSGSMAGQCGTSVIGFSYSGSVPYFPGNHKTVSSPTLSGIGPAVIQNIQSLSLK